MVHTGWCIQDGAYKMVHKGFGVTKLRVFWDVTNIIPLLRERSDKEEEKKKKSNNKTDTNNKKTKIIRRSRRQQRPGKQIYIQTKQCSFDLARNLRSCKNRAIMHHSPQGLWHHKFKGFWGRHKYIPPPFPRERSNKES